MGKRRQLTAEYWVRYDFVLKARSGGKPHKEIAAQLGVTPDRTRQMEAFARKHGRHCLIDNIIDHSCST